MTHRRALIIRIESSDGLEGWGECVADSRPNYTSETVDIARLVIVNWLAPRLVAEKFTAASEVRSTLDVGVKGHWMAKAGLEMATWELEARTKAISLSHLLGGTRDKIDVGVSLGIQKNPAVLVAVAEQAAAQGYRRIKLKIEPNNDVEFVAAVRESLGETDLSVDANAAYERTDMEPLLALDELGLIMIEQPFAARDLVAHARLQKRLRTPVCLDESIEDLRDAEDMVELGSGRIINIKPGRVGGFRAAKAIHDFAVERAIPVWCGGMLETGIGRAHNVALASLPGFVLAGDLSPSARYWERDIVVPEWTMDGDGRVEVPRHGVGMGVEVDLDRLDDLTTWETTITG